jgi:two-component system chemotaxis response regulator CheB
MENSNIIVIGSSAGGISALKELVSSFPKDFSAAIFVVQHLPPDTESRLPGILTSAGKLSALHPKDGEEIKPGQIYVSPPDHHMIVKGQSVLVRKSPKENRFRPSIDATMRSIAYQYGPRAIGVVLTGKLDDGTSGLWSIKEMGGITIVQSPDDALFADMPNSVLQYVDVDHIIPLTKMGELIVRLASRPTEKITKVEPSFERRLELEVGIAAEENALEKGITEMGEKTNLTCPECGGALVSLKEGSLLRYRCHTGHGYSSESLWLCINEIIEAKLWQAVRSVEEGIIFLEQSATHSQHDGNEGRSVEFYEKAAQLKARSKDLLNFIYQGTRIQ